MKFDLSYELKTLVHDWFCSSLLWPAIFCIKIENTLKKMFLFFSIEHCTEINKNIDCQWPISEIRDFNIRQQTCESKNWNQMTQFRAINIQFFHYSISIKFKTLLITYLSFLGAPISYKCPPLLCNNSRRSECNAFYICLVIIMVTLQPTLPVLPKFSYVP